LDADRGGMDRHPRLLRSVAAFTAPAEWPAAWSRYTTTGCAINSLSGKFAVGHNRRSERYPRDAANAIGGQSSAPVAESSFTGARANSHKNRCKSVTDFETSCAGLRIYRGYGIASAHAIWASKPSVLAMPR
jgi:hypothetical protein